MHEINEHDNFGEVRANGKRAWHGLGEELETGLQAWPAFQRLGLDWETELTPLVATPTVDEDAIFEEGTDPFEVTTHFAHRRKDIAGSEGVLGVVSSGYKPISNEELATMADALVDAADGQVEIETAGSLRNGRNVFALIKLPNDLKVSNEDILKQYVLLRNSHDGSAAFQIYPTTVRVVCANTLRYSSVDAKSGISFKHQGDVKQKLNYAKLALGMVADAGKRMELEGRMLRDRNMTTTEVRQYFLNVYEGTFGVVGDRPESELLSDQRTWERKRNKRAEVLEAWQANMEEEAAILDGINGTAWGAYNAVSKWNDHTRSRYRSVQEGSERRIHSNLFGVSHVDKNKAYREALELVKS